ncbi:MAG: DUF5916 domain-containing protein [Armatimonadetes bacterium]|nr:DUF5916 domain-containing protein [Armatimonadota bacterium]
MLGQFWIRRGFVCAAMATSVVTMAVAQPDLKAVKVAQAPVIDGKIEPNEYPAEARGEGFSDKDTNLASDEFGEFWLVYTDKAVYLAARFKTDPRKVVRQEYRQNVGLSGNDNVRLDIDPFGNASNFNSFGTNSNGATSISLSGGRAAKTEWLGEILANGRVTETGWEAEMRIPWAIMNMPPMGQRDMRFNVNWFRSNKSNTYSYKFTNNRAENIPVWQGVQVPAVDRSRVLNLLPYGVSGIQEGEKPINDAGLDFKTSIGETLSLVGTVNPDFRNIESSILSLDFSYFERLASENRPFFQEGNDYIRTGFEQRLFASQRIRSFDAGLKLYGTIGEDITVGALSTFNFGNQIANVVSVGVRPKPEQQFQFAYVGNLQEGRNSNGVMLNYFDRVGDLEVYSTNQLSDDQNRGSGIRNSMGVSYNKGSQYISLDLSQVSADFNPWLGFSSERNYYGASLFYNADATPSSGPVNSFEYGFGGRSYVRHGGDFYRDGLDIYGSVNLKNGFAIGGSIEWDKFEQFADHSFEIGMGYPYNNPYNGLGFEYAKGTFRNENFESYEVDFRWRPLNRLQLNAGAEFIDHTTWQTQYIISANYDFNRLEAVGGRAVYEDDRWNWYLSYRLSGGKGAEYFVLVGDPRADSFQNRLVIKAVVPITVKY